MVEQIIGVTECVQNIVEEGLMIRVMERDTAADIFSYISTGEMATATLVNTGMDDRVQTAYNSRQWYKFVSTRRLCECIHVIQMGMTQDRAHKHTDEAEQGDYAEIAVSDNR